MLIPGSHYLFPTRRQRNVKRDIYKVKTGQVTRKGAKRIKYHEHRENATSAAWSRAARGCTAQKRARPAAGCGAAWEWTAVPGPGPGVPRGSPPRAGDTQRQFPAGAYWVPQAFSSVSFHESLGHSTQGARHERRSRGASRPARSGPGRLEVGPAGSGRFSERQSWKAAASPGPLSTRSLRQREVHWDRLLHV